MLIAGMTTYLQHDTMQNKFVLKFDVENFTFQQNQTVFCTNLF